ncbi:carbon monoxide dehydrogenase beta subunit family protein [Methanothermococcus okinawensis]|uniref:CO dehydrogenase/acetyl-CoA synthase complex, epsilon subunit n=1 Tax=Methanothermococcus okinawensis (strain DSM 14208 / JCM 11175 / IH1) TaxID=647113 RepID=F8AM38_METOI|nr:carbon monoxide dehydrogenase beta subunit family protein [Methanothermococcus okinawensis]AEH06723.1 CO dehydrogenase/acetyl-CoA synthase complex, epsilon subunit [Methanothermococcus okinawensis IH1]
MLGKTTPYQPTAGSNLNHAEIVSTKIAVSMIKRSKNPILILGPKEEELEYLEHLNIEKIYTPRDMNLLDAIKKISDEKKHDLVIFSGITYYYLAQALTHLKHFSDSITLTIDRKYHPNAKYSFPNMEKEEHLEAIKRLVMLLNNP